MTADVRDRLRQLTEARETCPQAWHGGLPVGLLRECKYQAGHRGQHRDASRDLSWSGKLTEVELRTADRIRAVVAAAGDQP